MLTGKKIFVFIFVMLCVSASILAQEKGMGGVSTCEAKTYTSRRTIGITDDKAAEVLAVADFDGDGTPDVITSNMGGTPSLLRNVSETKNNWLAIKLIGNPAKKTPKDAVGSVVYITTGKLRQRFDLTSGGSYASQNEQIIHAGLGEATKIDKLEVVWANGQTEDFPIEKINTQTVIKQGNGK